MISIIAAIRYDGPMWIPIAIFAGFVLIRILDRYFLNLGPTGLARHEYVLAMLRSRSFEELSEDGNEDAESQGRTWEAHRIAHRSESGEGGVLVEFDVHPSRAPFTMGYSSFICVADAEHLEVIKAALEDSEDYSPFFGSKAQVERIARGEKWTVEDLEVAEEEEEGGQDIPEDEEDRGSVMGDVASAVLGLYLAVRFYGWYEGGSSAWWTVPGMVLGIGLLTAKISSAQRRRERAFWEKTGEGDPDHPGEKEKIS